MRARNFSLTASPARTWTKWLHWASLTSAYCKSRAHVDEIAAWCKVSGTTSLYESEYPYAGGPGYYALYGEDPDRIKVEVVVSGGA